MTFLNHHDVSSNQGKENLEKTKSTATTFKNVNEQRDEIIADASNRLFTRKDFRHRGINSSELNGIINRAMASK